MALLALALSACAPFTRYNVTVAAEPHIAYHLVDIDRAIEALDLAFAEADLLELGVSEQIIASRFLDLKWRRMPFKCGLPYSDDRLVAGCTWEHEVEVGDASCVGRTALLHELTHVILGHVNAREPTIYAGKPGWSNDPDPDHLQTRWWQIQGLADARLRDECDL